MHRENDRIKRKQSNINYLLGKGCNSYYNISDEELKEKVQEAMNDYVTKERFKERALRSYESGKNRLKEDYDEDNFYKGLTYKEWVKRCNEYDERIINILDAL